MPLNSNFPIDPQSPGITKQLLIFTYEIYEYKFFKYYRTVNGFYMHSSDFFGEARENEAKECSQFDFDQAKYYGRKIL